ncbi:LytR/AlgR family response regulator transcription factor [Taibaiella chishuiensis]|uniref:LytTR family two component transcriptional regulator n=1 Tax=Taibaiella chishuiensis TaxID=1434707 RepID=A0A2P8CT33_9BACT|nr:LytTR family DNA-binding domain-containing protein [Taibaiella chishuiensis]PSK88110.1 LytTR family two component transcriptional regulator [Taibaiella chishuiensis]
MKIVIIEDEVSSQNYLQHVLHAYFPNFEIKAIVDSVPLGVTAINEYTPDIVFLDVEIKAGTGFDVLGNVTYRDFQLVFTTAFSSFAVQAFRHNAIDYLLKPLNETQIIEAVDRCVQKSAEQGRAALIDNLLSNLRNTSGQKIRFVVHDPEGLDFIELSDIVYVEAKGNYTEFKLNNGSKVTTTKKIGELEDSLPKQYFFRTHHSYIVNIRCIKRYYKGRGGYVLLLDNTSIPVSSAKKYDFINWLG